MCTNFPCTYLLFNMVWRHSHAWCCIMWVSCRSNAYLNLVVVDLPALTITPFYPLQPWLLLFANYWLQALRLQPHLLIALTLHEHSPQQMIFVGPRRQRLLWTIHRCLDASWKRGRRDRSGFSLLHHHHGRRFGHIHEMSRFASLLWLADSGCWSLGNKYS